MRPRLSHSTVVRHTAVSRGHRLEACGSDGSGSLGVQRSSRPRAIASCVGADLAVNRGIWAGVRSFGSHVQFSRELFCSVAEVACVLLAPGELHTARNQRRRAPGGAE